MKSNSRSIQCYKMKLKSKSIKKGPKKTRVNLANPKNSSSCHQIVITLQKTNKKIYEVKFSINSMLNDKSGKKIIKIKEQINNSSQSGLTC